MVDTNLWVAVLLAGFMTGGVQADNGVIRGVVKWKGKVPARKKIRTVADFVCQEVYQDAPLLSGRLIVNDNSTLRNAFVYVEGDSVAGRSWPAPSDPVTMLLRDCRNEPHVFGVMVGQPLVIRNEDKTSHVVSAYNPPEDPFPIGNWSSPQDYLRAEEASRILFSRCLPKRDMEFEVAFTEPEMMITLRCGIHPWNSSYCAAMAHPFFTVTDNRGEFEVSGLPPGEYNVHVWHEHRSVNLTN